MKRIYIDDHNFIRAIFSSESSTRIAITSKNFTLVELSDEIAATKKLGDKLTKEEINHTIKKNIPNI